MSLPARQWHLYAWLAAVFALLFVDADLAAEAPGSREYQLKAAFLYNFTKFVEWPPHCFAGTQDPFVIGIMGQAPLGAELERAVKSRKVAGREIVVKRVESAGEAAGAHLLFVSAAENARFEGMQSAISRSPVLTVGESPMFARAGGTISFVLENRKLRFEINMDAAERAGLRVSSQLQKLATVVRRHS